jgi:mRNA interferase MazF
VSVAARRGDVCWVALDPAFGAEIEKTRPAVVVSNDSCNRFGARVVVVPLTSRPGRLYPGDAGVSVRGKPARALGDQIRAVDKRRLRGRVDRLSAADLAAVDEALRITLDLP